MPVIQVQALPQPEGVSIPRALRALCQAVAGAMGVDAAHVWATWHTLSAGCYVEGGEPASVVTQPRDSHPPIARLSAFVGRDARTIEAALTAAAESLIESLSLGAGNAFVTYDELASGRVYTGGTVRKRETR